jgi:uncharacterized protein HemX
MSDALVQFFKEASALVLVLFTFLVVMVWGVKPIVIKWLEVIQENNRARNQNDQKKNEVEERQAKALEELREELKTSRTINEQMLGLIATLPSSKDIQAAREAMERRANERDEALATGLSAIHTAIDATPGRVWEAGDPKLNAIKTLLETYLSGMEQRLVERIDPAARTARQVVTQELKDLRAQVDRQFGVLFARLEDINAALKVLPKSDPVIAQEENEKDDEPILPTT